MESTWTMFAVISALGLIGVASMAPVVPSLLGRVIPASAPRRIPMRAVAALAVAQAALVVLACAWIGARLGIRLGLTSAVFGTGASAQPWWRAALRPILLGVIIGGVGGIVTVRTCAPLVAYLERMPFPTRILYGGFTEEIIMRWGLMTALVAALSHTATFTSVAGRTAVVIAAIITTNLVFAASHLPLLRATKTSLPGTAVATIFVVSLPWGWLFWQYGIASAMIAHMTFHAAIRASGVRWAPGLGRRMTP